MDYYRKLNEASRRNVEQPASPAAATPVSLSEEKECGPPVDEQQLQQTASIECERISAAPATPISRERYRPYNKQHPLLL